MAYSKREDGNFPAYCTVTDWRSLSGMGRSSAYEALGRGDLRAVKVGTRTLINVQHGLAWLASLPVASIRPHGASRKTPPLNKNPGAGGQRGES